jgi:hypothetical protein
MDDVIKIEFDMESIEKKTADEKLNLLLRIAFSNHTKLVEHGKIIFGDNGKEGLVETVRSVSKRLAWCWVVGTGIVSFLSVVLAQHLLKA